MTSNDRQLVGIDLGTSGLRTVAYSERGNVIDNKEVNITQQTQKEWELALKKTVLDLPDGEKICSVDSTSGTAVLTDKYGNMVFPPLMYYKSAPNQAKKIETLESAEKAKNKGMPISSTSPLPKIMRMKEEYPRKFEQVEWILSPTTWLLYRLKYKEGREWNNLRTDWTNALKFGADITISKPKWFEPLFESVDVSLNPFPKIHSPGSFLGIAESNLSRKLKLRGARLYQGLTDGNASALAMGCLQPGDYGISCGSTSVPKFVSEKIKPHEAIYYHRHPISGYLAGAAFETGIIARWFCEKVLGISLKEGLRLARSCEIGSEYRFYPQSTRSPFFDPEFGNTLGGFFSDKDISKKKVKGRCVRGIVTGIAMEEYHYILLFENLFKKSIDEVHFLSGGAPSKDDPFRWWNRLRASIWDRKFIEMGSRTTAGTVLPASLKASIYKNIEEASDSLLEEKGEIEKDEKITSEYKERRENFFKKWKKIRDLSHSNFF